MCCESAIGESKSTVGIRNTEADVATDYMAVTLHSQQAKKILFKWLNFQIKENWVFCFITKCMAIMTVTLEREKQPAVDKMCAVKPLG